MSPVESDASSNFESSLPEYLQPLLRPVQPFPYEAVRVAAERREESTPYFLQALEEAIRDPEGEWSFLFRDYSMFLLAQFREARAFPLIIRLARLPVFELLTGDIVTEGLPQILASLCGGDLAPLQALVEDTTLDEFVRSAGLQAITICAFHGIVPREEVSQYFGQLFSHRLERVADVVWCSLVIYCADLRLKEHLPAIEWAYEEDLADAFYGDLEEVYEGIDLPLPTGAEIKDNYRLVDDVAREMSWYQCFQPGYKEEELSDEELDELDAMDAMLYSDTAIPEVRLTPKIGRNDPCPCRSGKKYKKCCGALA
jgi:hypothetical protein